MGGTPQDALGCAVGDAMNVVVWLPSTRAETDVPRYSGSLVPRDLEGDFVALWIVFGFDAGNESLVTSQLLARARSGAPVANRCVDQARRRFAVTRQQALAARAACPENAASLGRLRRQRP